MNRLSIIVALAGIAAALASQDARGGDPIAHYAADGNALDSAGSHHGVPMNGAGFGPGITGEAFALNGANQWFSAPDSPDWHFDNSAFTAAAWVNFSSIRQGPLGSLPNVFVAQDDGSGSLDKWVFFFDGFGKLCFHINGPGSVFMTPPTLVTPATGEWHHYAVVRSGMEFTFYADGISLGSAFTALPVPNSDAPLNMGQAEGLGYLHGRIDDVQIYRRALSASDVQFLAEHPGLEVGTPLCAADLNHDGTVDGADLGQLLGSWGSCGACAADINGDGVADGADLGLLLGSWGACP